VRVHLQPIRRWQGELSLTSVERCAVCVLKQ
jgi:hypothetical protein